MASKVDKLKEKWPLLIAECPYPSELIAAIEKHEQGVIGQILDAFLFEVWEAGERWKPGESVEFLKLLFKSENAEQFMRRMRGAEKIPTQ